MRIFEIILILTIVIIVNANTSVKYPGITFDFQSFDHDIRLESMSVDIGGGIGNQFGFASDIYGDWIVGGTGSNTYVLLYKLNDSNIYEREQKITGKGGAVTRLFNNTLVIGGHSTYTYIFENQNDIWTEVAALPTSSYCSNINTMPCDTVSGTDDGKYIIVGGPTVSNNAGVVRIYERVGDTWANTPRIMTFGGLSASRFGEASCMSGNGNYSAACGPGPDSTGTPNNDYCKIYKRDGIFWSLFDTITKTDDAVDGQTAIHSNLADFGASCEFNYDGDTLFVQHPVTSLYTPKILVFDRDDNTNTYERSTFIGNVFNSNEFGYKMRWDNIGNRLFVSDHLETTAKNPNPDGMKYHGKVWVFYDSGGNVWIPQEYTMVSPSPNTNDRCGQSIGVYGSTVVAGCRFWDELNTGMTVATLAGKLAVWDDVPQYPTPAPTQSPTTSAPTMSPIPTGVTVGKVEVKLINTNPASSQTATNDAIADIKNSTAGTTIKVKTTEKATLPSSFYSSNSNKTQLKENIKAARGCTDCQVVFKNIPGARRMLQGGDVTVEIIFALDDTAYAELVNTGNNLDDPQFLTELATASGVPEGDISVTVIGTEVVLEVTLVAYPDENGNPVTEDSIQDLQNLQANVETIAQTVISEVGDGEIESQVLDLCGERDCSGRGTCNTETGICVCTGDWWGINCESTCECYNGGECFNSYCQCLFPYFGLRCDDIATLGPIYVPE